MTTTGMATVSGNRVWTLRRAAGWIALLAAAFALAAWLRHGVIQPREIGIACAQPDAPGWCQARQWLISAQHYRFWGWVGLGCAIVGLFGGGRSGGGRFWGGRVIVAIGLCFAALALVLYNATLGAPAMVIGLLALLRR